MTGSVVWVGGFLSETICLSQSTTPILLHHSKSLIKSTFSKTVSNLSVFSTVVFVSVVHEWCVRVCVCVCVRVCVCVHVGRCIGVAIVKRPVLSLHVEDGHCTNVLYYYLLLLFLQQIKCKNKMSKKTLIEYCLHASNCLQNFLCRKVIHW